MTLLTCGQMEIELSRFQKENNILELKVIEEHKKLKAKEEEMIMERTRVSITIVISLKLRTIVKMYSYLLDIRELLWTLLHAVSCS